MNTATPISAQLGLASANVRSFVPTSFVSTLAGRAYREQVTHLIFIDSGVTHPEILFNALLPNSRVFMLSASGDGVSQIADILAEFVGIESVQIFAHGTPGAVSLGQAQLNLERMSAHRHDLLRWREALCETAQLVLYSCRVAEGDRGAAFIQKLHDVLQVEIAASTTPVGSQQAGGNWHLDYTTSDFAPALALAGEAIECYPHTLELDVTLQAEDALLSGVALASRYGGAQGNRYVDYQNPSDDFIEWTVEAPAAGSYELSWRYANGSSNRPLSFVLNGKVVDDSLSFESTDRWSNWSLRTQTVDLQAGLNTIRLNANGNSGANFDSLRIVSAGTTPPDTTPPDTTPPEPSAPLNPDSTTGVGRLEAEQMTLNGYAPEASQISSGQQVIQVQETGVGTATTEFVGETGTYDIKVVYHDENDGNSTLAVTIDNDVSDNESPVVVDSWVLNEATDSTTVSAGNERSRIISGQTLTTGAVIEIQGEKIGNEFSRVDYIEIVPTDTTPDPDPDPNPDPDPDPTPFTTTIQAEDTEKVTLSGVSIESKNGGAQGGRYVDYQNANGDYVEWTVEAPAAGNYELSWRYANGSADNRPLAFSLNGAVVNNGLDFNPTGNWNTWTQTTQTVALQAGANQIKLQANGSSGANFDSLKVTQLSTTDGPLPVNVSLSDATATEGRDDYLVFDVSLSVPTDEAVTLNLTASDGSATGGPTADFGTEAIDYANQAFEVSADGGSTWTAATNGTEVTFEAGQQALKVRMAVNDDALEEGTTPETFSLSVADVVAGSVDSITDTGTGTIVDNDQPTGGNPDEPLNVTLQAEDALLSGVLIDSLRGGAEGNRYADFQNPSDDFIEWTVDAPSAGRYDLSWRYANGSSNRPLSFSVNGVELTDSLAFGSTGNWSNWIVQSQTVDLQAGANKIRLQANGNSGANFDYLKVKTAGAPEPRKLRILPMGDSNTRGQGYEGGYRIQFWERAANDGVEIDFVGNRQDGPTDIDRDHEGWGGERIPQMIQRVQNGTVTAFNPDMILFMMGTNDANSNPSNVASLGETMLNRLRNLIDAVHDALPQTHLFISSIPPLDTPKGTEREAAAADYFNARISTEVVDVKASEGKRVSYVNAGGSLSIGDINGDNSATSDQDDGLHPTVEGYTKLGNTWYNAVSQSDIWQTLVAEQNNVPSSAPVAAQLVVEPAPVVPTLVSMVGDSENNVLQSSPEVDELTGNGGADVFVYDSLGEGVDTITDFGSDDVLRLSAAGFGGDLVAGDLLRSSDYVLGSNPLDGGSTFLYNTGSNLLSFDADGTGNGAAVGFATFSNGFVPEANQFELIA